MNGRIARGASVAAMVLLAVAAPVAAEEHRTTGLLVSGPPSVGLDPPGYELEMRGVAFTIRAPSRGTVEGPGEFTVTLRRLDTCAVVVRFTARPGQNYQVNSNGDGTFRVDESRGLDGPEGTSHEPRCHALPDTSAGADTKPAASPGPTLVLALAAAVGAYVGIRRVPHRG